MLLHITPLTSQTAFGGQLPYKGSLVSPVVRFHYSPFEYDGRLLRATNHEPRATNFSFGCKCNRNVSFFLLYFTCTRWEQRMTNHSFIYRLSPARRLPLLRWGMNGGACGIISIAVRTSARTKKYFQSTVFEPFSEEHSLLPQHDVIGESRRVEKKCKMCIYSSKQNFDFEGLCKGLLDSPLRIRISWQLTPLG